MVGSMETPVDAAIAPAVSWAQVADDLWVGSADGNFVGRIELVEERYVAIDGRGDPLGVNGSLEMALLRFEGWQPQLGVRTTPRFARLRRRFTRARRGAVAA
jgi:hypothetical protein